jgi:hypothetical protein
MLKPVAAALLVVGCLALFAVPFASAGGESGAKPVRLEALKKLAGTWNSADKDGDGKPDVTANYRVTAGGTAVMETLFPGTDEEMITMYFMDGEDLMLTHYCRMGNQPRMKARAETDPKVLSFAFQDCTNIKSRDEQHMDSLTMTLKDESHLRAEWTLWQGGKVTRNIAFDLAREGK